MCSFLFYYIFIFKVYVITFYKTYVIVFNVYIITFKAYMITLKGKGAHFYFTMCSFLKHL